MEKGFICADVIHWADFDTPLFVAASKIFVIAPLMLLPPHKQRDDVL
jgi:hypothetical protein